MSEVWDTKVDGVQILVMMNTALLWSPGLASASLTLTRHSCDGISGMFPVKYPSSGVSFVISVQPVPLSAENNIFTLPLVRPEVHVIGCGVPLRNVSPPFGDVTVIKGGEGIVKTESLWSPGVPSISDTETRHRDERTSGIVHAKDPSSGVLSVISIQE